MAARLNNIFIWVGLIVFLVVFPATASADSKWFTRVWQIDDGLLDNDVNGIVQGPNNYLWLVTPEGVMQFDGVNFTPFAVEDNTSSSSHVRMMLCSQKGTLWFAYDGGQIIGINPDFSTILLDSNKLPTHSPLSLASGGDGTLWLGYSDAIYRAQNGQITKMTAADGVPPGIFHLLSSDEGGSIWLAKGSQISYFENGRFQNIASVEGVQGMAARHTNGVWLVAGTHLYSCNTNGQLWDYGAFQNAPKARGVALLEDQSGAVWIGTAGNGLFCYNQSNFERVETSHSFILSLAKDHEGNIWVGTGGGGLDRVTPCGIWLEVQENSQIQSQIQSICQDTNGVLWGATQNGMLLSRSSGSWVPAFTNAPFAGNVTCVAANRSTIWVGTRNDVLWKITGTNYVSWRTNLAQGPINGLLPSPNGDLWIAGINTLEHLHKKRASNMTLPRFRRIYAITRDATGSVWLGADSTLLRFDGTNMFEVVLHLGPGRTICCLYGTDDGSLWIGSSGGGLMRLKNGNLEQIGLNQGLMSDYISQMVADRDGWLWFGSKRGIFKLRQRDVERAMEDTNVILRPIVYGKNDGLISLEAVFSIASPFILPHALLSDDGRVWMLMHTGIVVADPEILSESSTPPPILLTQVAMDGQIIASHNGAASIQIASRSKTMADPLEIPPSHRHLEFDFTAFHFSAPENIRFRYQLTGFDTNWIDTVGHSATYSRLTAGEYQFRVEASVGDNPWSYPPATVSFIVAPFFWETWWFRFGVGLLFTLVLIAIVRYVSYRRLRQKLRTIEQQAAVERERGRIARDIHDDLGNRLTEIQLLTGLAQRNREVPQNTAVHFDEISSAARQATDALDEIVWAINPRNDTLPHLINYLGQFVTDYLRTAGIPCRVDLPENPPTRSVSAEVRHNLFLAIKESLNNIVRHANATEVFMRILATDKFLSVIIEDNGRGFNDQTRSNGADGLENMRQRIAEIGGQFQIESKPGVGTAISFNGQWLAEQ
jgi:signal transduction histidine kinase/ligand-binding sensor domain-containing protein